VIVYAVFDVAEKRGVETKTLVALKLDPLAADEVRAHYPAAGYCEVEPWEVLE
jgi:hypothetical protein